MTQTETPRPARERKDTADTAKKGSTPRTSGTTENPPPAKVKRVTADVKLRESVKGMYEGVGMLAFTVGMARESEPLSTLGQSLVGEPPDLMTAEGVVVANPDPRTGAEKVADAWMVLADRNPRVKAILQRVTEGGAVAEVATLHLAFVMPFLPGIPGFAKLFTPPRAPAPDPAMNGAGVN